jgi:arylsulfatase A-like enzyme
MRRRAFLLAAAVPKRPNVVFFVADDLGWRDVEPYGSTQVRTPVLAALAKQGMCLDAMFTATAMCAPTRQQILTGMWPVRNGAYPNHSRVHEGVKGLPVYFKELGYRVARTGKKHWTPSCSGTGRSRFSCGLLRINPICRAMWGTPRRTRRAGLRCPRTWWTTFRHGNG